MDNLDYYMESKAKNRSGVLTASRSALPWLLFMLLSTSLPAANPAVAPSPVLNYVLSFPEPWTQYAEVSLTLSNPKGTYTDLDMAAWTPGSYMIRDFAGAVEAVSAANDAGETLQVAKTDKDTWRVQHGKGQTFTLQYRVYCATTGVRESFVDRERATIIPASVFLYPAGFNLASTIRIQPWKEWTVISTALEPLALADPWALRAGNLDELLDSPMEIGNHRVLRFDVDGTAHELAIQGAGNFDTTRLISDIGAIVRSCTDLFGDNPNPRYVFLLNNTSGSYGGLEHAASTSLVYRRWGFAPEDRYQVFLGLVSHEYFHLWVAKRIRPVEYSTFTYDREQHSELLWVSEGFTSYYDDLLLRRAGLLSEDSYLGMISSGISHTLNRPGDRVQSVAESSFDAWIKYYKGNENSSNSTVSYYDKGRLLALALDLDILASSQGERRLDDVLRSLYAAYKADPERGYSTADLKRLLEEAAGKSLDGFFRDYVDGTVKLDLAPYFDRIGVALVDDGQQPQQLTFGASVDAATSKISRVVRDQPAAKTGLRAGDEILAIDGHRFAGNLTEWLDRHQQGRPMRVLISRDGILQELEVLPEALPKHQFRLEQREDASEAQQALYRQWLSLP